MILDDSGLEPLDDQARHDLLEILGNGVEKCHFVEQALHSPLAARAIVTHHHCEQRVG